MIVEGTLFSEICCHDNTKQKTIQTKEPAKIKNIKEQQQKPQKTRIQKKKTHQKTNKQNKTKRTQNPILDLIHTWFRHTENCVNKQG